MFEFFNKVSLIIIMVFFRNALILVSGLIHLLLQRILKTYDFAESFGRVAYVAIK